MRKIESILEGSAMDDNACHIRGHKGIRTSVTHEDEEKSVADEYGVIYSRDGKRLLSALYVIQDTYRVKEGTEVICDGAFGWSHIRHLHLPDSLLAIGYDAFGHSELESLNIPKNVRHIGTVNPAANCLTLKEVTCESEHLCFENGLLYTHDHKILYGALTQNFPAHLILPDELLVIANGAFIGRKKLEWVFIPDSVIQMGKGSFCGTSLTHVHLSHSIVQIPTECFDGCQLEDVDIPEGVKRIYDGAFCDNCHLRTIILHRNRRSIKFGRNAYDPCVRVEVAV